MFPLNECIRQRAAWACLMFIVDRTRMCGSGSSTLLCPSFGTRVPGNRILIDGQGILNTQIPNILPVWSTVHIFVYIFLVSCHSGWVLGSIATLNHVPCHSMSPPKLPWYILKLLNTQSDCIKPRDHINHCQRLRLRGCLPIT